MVPITRSTNGWDSGTCGTVLISSISKIRRFAGPAVCLKHRVMIGTEISGYALSAYGRVQHATDFSARDGATVDAEAVEATRELVHDHKHRVAPEHDRLAAKQVDAPRTVCGVSDERQPRRAGSTGSRAIV